MPDSGTPSPFQTRRANVTAFRSINLISILLCFCVVVFGAYVRLADAGLGCPDWPGCYGHIGVPDADHEVAAAEQKFPERPVEAHKAWKEMGHRYTASTLGLLIVVMAFISAFSKNPAMPRVLPWALVGLVIFQGILGMWTVTLQLKPLVVTGHLFGGLATLSLLVLMWLSTRAGLHPDAPRSAMSVALASERPRGVATLAVAGMVLLVCQIFLGGWTSTNYAALACPDLPTCHGQWLPDTDVKEAFTLWRGLGVNYEFGVLDNRARVTIHLFHRIGAIVVSGVLLLLGLLLLLRSENRFWQVYGGVLIGALSVQVLIGVSTVLLQLPLLLAAAHNAGAAILLLTVVSLNYFIWSKRAV